MNRIYEPTASEVRTFGLLYIERTKLYNKRLELFMFQRADMSTLEYLQARAFLCGEICAMEEHIKYLEKLNPHERYSL